MNVALWVVQGLLAVVYVMAGGMQTFNPTGMQAQVPSAKRHSLGFLRFVGVVELLGAAGLILPMLTGILPWLTPLAAVGLTIVQLLAAAVEHLPHREYKSIPLNLVLLVMSAFVAYGRFALSPA